MSASAAKVFSGLMNAITPATRNSTPKMANSHLPCSAMPASAKFCSAVPRNMTPTMTPTVVIEAWSNCRITTEATIQTNPNTSHSHQNLEKPLIASRSALVGPLGAGLSRTPRTSRWRSSTRRTSWRKPWSRSPCSKRTYLTICSRTPCSKTTCGSGWKQPCWRSPCRRACPTLRPSLPPVVEVNGAGCADLGKLRLAASRNRPAIRSPAAPRRRTLRRPRRACPGRGPRRRQPGAGPPRSARALPRRGC